MRTILSVASSSLRARARTHVRRIHSRLAVQFTPRSFARPFLRLVLFAPRRSTLCGGQLTQPKLLSATCPTSAVSNTLTTTSTWTRLAAQRPIRLLSQFSVYSILPASGFGFARVHCTPNLVGWQLHYIRSLSPLWPLLRSNSPFFPTCLSPMRNALATGTVTHWGQLARWT